MWVKGYLAVLVFAGYLSFATEFLEKNKEILDTAEVLYAAR